MSCVLVLSKFRRIETTSSGGRIQGCWPVYVVTAESGRSRSFVCIVTAVVRAAIAIVMLRSVLRADSAATRGGSLGIIMTPRWGGGPSFKVSSGTESR